MFGRKMGFDSMSESKDPSLTPFSSSVSEVSEEGETPTPTRKIPIRKRRLVMLCNTIGFIIVLIVVTISLSFSSSEEANLGFDIHNQSTFYNETVEPLPTPEARYSKRNFVAFMPISVNHDDIESFPRLDYYDNDHGNEEYFGDIEEDRFGSHGLKHRLHRRPSRPRNPYRKKRISSVMSLPRIRNRAKLDNNTYKKKNHRVSTPKKYSDVPDLHQRPGPPYHNTFKYGNSPLKRVSKPRTKKKKSPSTLIIIDKRKKGKKNGFRSSKYAFGTPYKNSSKKMKFKNGKRRRKVKENSLQNRFNDGDRRKYEDYNTHYDDNIKNDEEKKLKSNRSFIRRPPPKHPGVRIPGVRYPLNSGSIRDIIDFMHSKPHEETELDSNAAGLHHTAHKGYYYSTGNPPSKEGNAVSYEQNNQPQKVQTVSYTPSKYFNPDKYNYVFLPTPKPKTTRPKIKISSTTKKSKVYDPYIMMPQGYPVHSLGFDPSRPDGPDYSEVTSIKKSSSPLSIGLDVYPIGANGHSKSSSRFSNRHGSNKQEVLLHLNLFSNKPQVSKISSLRPVVTSKPKVHFSKKPHLPTSYYYFSTPGNNNYHNDSMYHPAQSSSLVSTHESLNRNSNNGRVDSSPSPEDIFKYLASGINQGNFRIGNHEIKISSNIQNTSNLMDHHRLSNYLTERSEEDVVLTRRLKKEQELEAKESNYKHRDNDVSTTRIIETYEKPIEREITSTSTSSPIQIENHTENGDFEYYYQYYYDYVYPEELSLKEGNNNRTIADQ